MNKNACLLVLEVGTYRFSDNYAWFLEYRSVLPIACRYTAIAWKTQLTLLISIRTLPGQMSRELDPASISSLCHGTTEHYVPKRQLH